MDPSNREAMEDRYQPLARLTNMNNNRLNYNIFKYNYNLMKSQNTGVIAIEVADVILVINSAFSNRDISTIINQFQSKLFDKYKVKWNAIINSNFGVSGSRNGNKLRSYKQFKMNLPLSFMLWCIR